MGSALGRKSFEPTPLKTRAEEQNNYAFDPQASPDSLTLETSKCFRDVKELLLRHKKRYIEGKNTYTIRGMGDMSRSMDETSVVVQNCYKPEMKVVLFAITPEEEKLYWPEDSVEKQFAKYFQTGQMPKCIDELKTIEAKYMYGALNNITDQLYYQSTYVYQSESEYGGDYDFQRYIMKGIVFQVFFDPADPDVDIPCWQVMKRSDDKYVRRCEQNNEKARILQMKEIPTINKGTKKIIFKNYGVHKTFEEEVRKATFEDLTGEYSMDPSTIREKMIENIKEYMKKYTPWYGHCKRDWTAKRIQDAFIMRIYNKEELKNKLKEYNDRNISKKIEKLGRRKSQE